MLGSGVFTQGGETGLPSYSLCVCDIPNRAAGLELALGREGLLEEGGRVMESGSSSGLGLSLGFYQRMEEREKIGVRN